MVQSWKETGHVGAGNPQPMPEGATDKDIVERGVVVTLEDDEDATASYVVMGVHGKHYNKWYLTLQDEPVGLQAKKTRLHLRKKTLL